MASTIYAERRSLERMRDKRQKILDDPEAYRWDRSPKSGSSALLMMPVRVV
jgi:hypothetical protein